jgi:hypothetical protein
MRYLIVHRRTLTVDLIDEEGKLSIERLRRGVRMRMSVDEFEQSDDAPPLREKLRRAIARARKAHDDFPTESAGRHA